MRKLIFILLLVTLILQTVGCSKQPLVKKKTIFVSILPQKFFVEKIAGDRFNIEVLVSPGKNPATYEPKPKQIANLGNAKALFTIGVSFEKAFIPKIEDSIKSLKIIDTSNGIKKKMMQTHRHEEKENHSHDEHGGEEYHEKDEHKKNYNEVPDPHIWLSPSLVKIQAKNIYETLIEIDPDGKSKYEKGFNSFIKELDNLISELQETLNPYKGSTLFVFHPAFGYFAEEFGLKQVAIETGGKEPTPAKLKEIIELAQKENVKIIFVQPEFSQQSAGKIANAIDGSVITLAPLNPDYINNLKKISTEVAKALK